MLRAVRTRQRLRAARAKRRVDKAKKAVWQRGATGAVREVEAGAAAEARRKVRKEKEQARMRAAW